MKFEQQLLVAFYIVRKLIESHQTHTALSATNFAGRSFPSRGLPITYVIWPDVERKYDLASGEPFSGTAAFIANQFIHSFVFCPTRDAAGGLSGVFVASDREKDQRVFWFSVDTLEQLLLAVASSRSRGFRVAPERNEMRYP